MQMHLDWASAGAQANDTHASLLPFHWCVRKWFTETLGEPTEPQVQAWPLIGSGADVLIAAPTGSGKTLSAFLACLNRLFCAAVDGALQNRTYVLYVSPLRALGNDVQKNLLGPLQEITAIARAAGLPVQDIRVDVRSGDTSSSDRARMVRTPPHILITTPESLYLCLTAEKARERLRHVETVVVDEIHALIRDKRGSHFALSMERLKHLCGRSPQLVGLSATQKPLDQVASFLTGEHMSRVKRVEVGHIRPWELQVDIPDAELSAVATHEMWGEIYDRLIALSERNRTILVFTNTRKLAERVAHDIGERMGKDLVAAHHGSMSRELRLNAEDRLKSGALRMMVATASLELGIDVGSIDLVVQLGSPRAIATMLQRVGRAGHRKSAISRGVIFAMTRDELLEATALLWAIKKGELDAPIVPEAPLDVLAQQIVAACAVEEWNEDALYALTRKAWPYRALTRDKFDAVLGILSEGVATSRGRAHAHLHRDRVAGMLRARKGAKLTALQNGGAIPDTFTYPVIAEPEGKTVGSLDEDFAVESSAGDVFLLGSTSWRIQRIVAGTVRVEDAAGQAPTVPFWRGEAPARTAELSLEVATLREAIASDGVDVQRDIGLQPHVAEQLLNYVRVSTKVLGAMPTQTRVVAERFFDEAGGMQLILHAPFGGRINRAWGMALRKRFCRSFDFELQAAAGDDGVLLSLGAQHSFALADIFDFLSPNNVEEILVQAILQAPLFGTRFRWNATRSLMLERMRNGERVPPQIQRARSDDLLASVFPQQVGCQDNHGGGDIEVPDHPLVFETLDNCLHEAMDVEGLKRVLAGLKDGSITRHSVDLPEPSPMAHQHLNSAPYTFLDDAPLEERRARAVSVRRSLRPEDAVAFGALDENAIRIVIADAAPVMRSPDELHDALLQLVVMREETLDAAMVEPLVAAQRACVVEYDGARFLVPRERFPHASVLFAGVSLPWPWLVGDAPVDRDGAIVACVRGRTEVCGPTTAAELARYLCVREPEAEIALYALEGQGSVLRGKFWPNAGDALQWCDRRLLQRIHRLTVGRLRQEIQPLSSADVMRFLFRWHHIDDPLQPRGRAGLLEAVSLLEGYEAQAGAWESHLLASRVGGFSSEQLDQLCFSGEVAWGRLTERDASPAPIRRGGVVADVAPRLSRVASLTFMRRAEMDWLLTWSRGNPSEQLSLPLDLSEPARVVALALLRRGASFFPELGASTKLEPEAVEDALWELLARGLVSADAVDNLRVLQSPKRRKRQKLLQRGGPGRWSLLCAKESFERSQLLEQLARLFLKRYGIVWRDLVVREALAPPWRELAFVYRRMEARGEIRGGRFAAGVMGEQFALPEAVDLARAVRREAPSGKRVVVSACDPLNLTGLVTPGARVAATLSNAVVYVDGAPLMEAAQHGEALVG